MSLQATAKKRQARAFQAFLLAAFSCVLGLSFCLIKSPQARSEAYIAAAMTAMAENRYDEAAAAALESVRLNPSAPKGWQILSRMLQQNGQTHAARQALSIAGRLQQNPQSREPLYAMPADFKLSLLALAENEIP